MRWRLAPGVSGDWFSVWPWLLFYRYTYGGMARIARPFGTAFDFDANRLRWSSIAGGGLMPGIFISYRRRGSQGFAGRLADDLIERFGAAQVFRDVEIRPGDDFTAAIQSAIANSGALLVVIGPRWLDHRDTRGKPRLHAPGDWVRLEIEAALARRARIVPVLVGGAPMPPGAALPESIRSLANIQAFELTDRRWDRDVEQLAAMLVRQIPDLESARKTAGKPRPSDRDQVRDSPARTIRDLGLRVLEEIGRAGRPARPSRPLSKRRGLSIGSYIGKRFKQLISIAIILGVGYVLIQNYGDPATRRMVDDIISRITAFAR
jgi:hypothetical protein